MNLENGKRNIYKIGVNRFENEKIIIINYIIQLLRITVIIGK
ncbi:MAG: hypothetical protein BAJALOKI3v1_550011 [Promethearchaeota archaeon]|jgi:hypothetical protein|nr:MAG: hypothetical protein BAJALOKI3v1_550011 [Candidatus Lokiarchaeota archaeon]